MFDHFTCLLTDSFVLLSVVPVVVTDIAFSLQNQLPFDIIHIAILMYPVEINVTMIMIVVMKLYQTHYLQNC